MSNIYPYLIPPPSQKYPVTKPDQKTILKNKVPPPYHHRRLKHDTKKRNNPITKVYTKKRNNPACKGGVVGENTESDHRELVVFYYLPENDRREFVGKWEPLVPYTTLYKK